MLKTRSSLATVILFSLPTSLLCAHEGHGHTTGQAHTPRHYLTEPIHLLQFGTLLLTALLFTYLASRWRHHTISHRPGNLA